MASGGNGMLRAVLDALMELVRSALRSSQTERSGRSSSSTSTKRRTTTRSRTSTRKASGTTSSKASSSYAGDASGAVKLTYDPYPDDKPDPGEIVWAWVPYEEDHMQGKDRPVLVVGRQSKYLLALMLTSQDHDGDRNASRWVDIGTGDWDAKRRPSEVRVDRVLRLDPDAVRRQGSTLDRKRFDRVAAGVHAARG